MIKVARGRCECRAQTAQTLLLSYRRSAAACVRAARDMRAYARVSHSSGHAPCVVAPVRPLTLHTARARARAALPAFQCQFKQAHCSSAGSRTNIIATMRPDVRVAAAACQTVLVGGWVRSMRNKCIAGRSTIPFGASMSRIELMQ